MTKIKPTIRDRLHRIAIRLFHCPRFFLFSAAFANLIHPIIHGTLLDGGAWDGALLALDGFAVSCCTDRH